MQVMQTAIAKAIKEYAKVITEELLEEVFPLLVAVLEVEDLLVVADPLVEVVVTIVVLLVVEEEVVGTEQLKEGLGIFPTIETVVFGHGTETATPLQEVTSQISPVD